VNGGGHHHCHQHSGFLVGVGDCCVGQGNVAYLRIAACWVRENDCLTTVSNCGGCRVGCHCDGVVAAGRVKGSGHRKPGAHFANVVEELASVIPWWW